jgi:hypothetical protein
MTPSSKSGNSSQSDRCTKPGQKEIMLFKRIPQYKIQQLLLNDFFPAELKPLLAMILTSASIRVREAGSVEA